MPPGHGYADPGWVPKPAYSVGGALRNEGTKGEKVLLALMEGTSWEAIM